MRLYVRNTCSYLSQYCSKFVLECREELAHDSLYIIVSKGLLNILEYEAESVLLLAFCNLVSSVYVEEADLLEKLLSYSECALAKVCIAYRLIKKDSKVTSYLRELREFLILDLVSLHKLEKCWPVDLSCKDRLLDAELLESCRSDRTHHGKRLMRTREVVCKAF